MPSPKLAPLLLSDAERESLEALARKRSASQSLVLRARIVLACAEWKAALASTHACPRSLRSPARRRGRCACSR